MSFYPILKAPDSKGWTTLFNFPPNNWEVKDSSEKYINVTWAEDGQWRTENVGKLAFNGIRTFGFDDLPKELPQGVLPLLSLTLSKLPTHSDSLPQLEVIHTSTPGWRATLGLSTEHTSTSYQGEIDPFPVTGSMVTFGPFMQFGQGIENFLILLNIEKSPVARVAQVEIFAADNIAIKAKFNVKNNDATIISLDGLGFSSTDLSLIICRSMSAIPLYFSKTSDGTFLSLEHTHPPASYVIHGNRWAAQKILKKIWFSRTGQ
jgi:hypothetical protein